MPVILEIKFTDGSKKELRLPAEIWRRDSEAVSKLIITEKQIESLTLDPKLETADGDMENNHYPRRPIRSRFRLFKEKTRKNAMQKAGLGKSEK